MPILLALFLLLILTTPALSDDIETRGKCSPVVSGIEANNNLNITIKCEEGTAIRVHSWQSGIDKSNYYDFVEWINKYKRSKEGAKQIFHIQAPVWHDDSPDKDAEFDDVDPKDGLQIMSEDVGETQYCIFKRAYEEKYKVLEYPPPQDKLILMIYVEGCEVRSLFPIYSLDGFFILKSDWDRVPLDNKHFLKIRKVPSEKLVWQKNIQFEVSGNQGPAD